MKEALLKEVEIEAELATASDWSREGSEIRRTIKFKDFPAAIAFVVRVSFASEAMDHHPDMDIRYWRVTLALTTHDSGGLTKKDFALARQIDEML